MATTFSIVNLSFADSPITFDSSATGWFIDPTGGDTVVNMPQVSASTGMFYIVKRVDPNDHTTLLTLNAYTGDTFNNISNYNALVMQGGDIIEMIAVPSENTWQLLTWTNV